MRKEDAASWNLTPKFRSILLLIHESVIGYGLVLVEVVIVCHVLQEIDGSVVANLGYQDSGLHPLHTNHHSLHVQRC